MRNKTLLFRWLQIFLIASLFGISFYPYLGEAIFLLVGISVAFGFMTWLGISLIFDSFDRWDVARLVRAALHGKRYRNGQRRAVLGRLYPLNETIKAPFSGREALIAAYDIYHSYWKRTKSGSTHLEPIIYSGYHLAPSEVRTGTETLRVLGFPNISDVPEQETTSYGRNTAFLETTQFTPRLRGSFMEGVNDLSRVIQVDDNGAVAEDYKFREPVLEQSVKSREQVVKKGADVCLIGVFDATRGAIVPGRFRFGLSMRLIPGTGEQIISGLEKGAGTVLVVGFIISLLCISAGLLPYAPDQWLQQLPFGNKMIAVRNELLPPEKRTFTQREAKKQPEKKTAHEVPRIKERSAVEQYSLILRELISTGDVDQLRMELNKGLDPDFHLISGNNYSLLLIEAIVENQLEIAQILLEFGADINAVNSYNINGVDAAIFTRDTEAVKFVLDAGAEISQRDNQSLSPLNRAILNQDVDILRLLLEAGADPSSHGCDQYLSYLPADSDKANRIRQLIQQAGEGKR